MFGPGLLVLGGTNSYTGTTTISAGTLQFGNGGATPLPPTSAYVDNGTLIFNSANNLSPASISGGGSVTQAANSLLSLAAGNAYGGTTTVSAGTLQFSGNNTIGNLAVPGGAVLVAAGTTSVAATNGNSALSAGGSLQVTGGVLNVSGMAWFSVGVHPGRAPSR